jgi:hypothetical protein
MTFTVNLKNDVFQPETGKLAPGMGIILLSWVSAGRLLSLTRENQQVTWNSPITAPSVLFQIRIASGVGSNFTWHLFLVDCRCSLKLIT